MTTTTFTTKETVIEAAWANDVDALVYDVFNAMSSAGADGTILVSDGTNFVKEAGATARTSLGLAIGTDVQAWDADLDAIAALAKTDSNVIVGDGSTWVAESGATARTSLGLGTGNSPQFTGIEVGHATDTTVTRASAGDIAVEGNTLYRAGGTDIPLTDGGTGASSKGAAQTALGIIPDDGAWAAYTPTISSGSGTITTASGTGRWLQQGKIIHFAVVLTITTNGTGAGYIGFTLPSACAASVEHTFVGQDRGITDDSTVSILQASSSTTIARTYFHTGAYPGANGAVIVVSGSYEVA